MAKVEASLAGWRVLVVEDEYMLASDLADIFEAAGAEVVGPAASVHRAMAQVEQGSRIDAALLDVNLGGEDVFPIADALTARGVPFIFATGYDASAIPARFRDVLRLEKPVEIAAVMQGFQRARNGAGEVPPATE